MKPTIESHPLTSRSGLFSSERRGTDRTKVRIPIRIFGRGLVGTVSQEGSCRDISEAGVGFETNADLFVGEIVELQFQLKDADRSCYPVRLLYKIGQRYGGLFRIG